MEKYICPHCKNLIDDDEALLCLYCGENLERGVGFIGRIRYSSHWAVIAFVVIVVVAAFVLLVSRAGAKQADLAGSWYSSSPEVLSAELKKYLSEAEPDVIHGDILGIMVPHAGFRFSGSVAAYAYKTLLKKNPKIVIVVGLTHRRYFPGKISVFTENSFVTPLGRIGIDQYISSGLIAYHENIQSIPDAFIEENSIEMQIPFIQTVINDPRLVLIVIGDQRRENLEILIEALYAVLRDKDDYVIVASSDMSHYLTYDDACEKDAQTVETVREFDPDALFLKSVRSGHDLMCGYGAVYAVMGACKKLGADETKILKYANSGDTSGKKDKVVGYLSAAFVDTGTTREGDTNMFNSEQHTELLKIARDTIRHYLETGKIPEIEVSDAKLEQDMGAFVTLRKNGRLRGCIGHMIASGPLYLTVRDMAVAAATEDPRFDPVTIAEADNIDIEISVLTPMRKIDDYTEIEVGKHGVMVRMGTQSGVYLPQVAVETGWDREQFMSSLCAQKAGIPRDAWKTGECDIYVFTAEVFGEKDTEK